MKKIIKSFLSIVIILFLIACSNDGTGINSSTLNNDSTFRVHFIDVGQGDAALVECDGHYMLIDGGLKSAGSKVKTILEKYNVKKLDFLVISHLHSDHVGGLIEGLDNIVRIKRTLCNSVEMKRNNFNTKEDVSSFKDLKHALRKKGSNIKIPKVGDEYKLGNAKIEILYTGLQKGNIIQNENESLVLLISYGKTQFMFTGDVEGSMESKICDSYNKKNPISVLKVAHHGSDKSTDVRFLEMFNPEYAVVSVGKNNTYRHPSSNTINKLKQNGSTILRTDENGDIIFTSNGRKVSVKTTY